MTKLIDVFDIEAEYIDFEDVTNILEDLTTEEIKEKKTIDQKYKNTFEKLKAELTQLHPDNPPTDYKEWQEYREKGSQEWQEKFKEIHKLNEQYREKIDNFITKLQERRFTEKIQKIGVERFLLNRIKEAEAEIKRVTEANKDPKNRIYTDFGLKEVVKNYEEVIRISQEILLKAKNTDKQDIENLSFSELLQLVNIGPLAEDMDEIELLNSIIPEKYIIPNNRLINKMAKNEIIYNEEFDLRINPESKNVIITKVSLNYDDENIKIYDKDKRFTPYDRTVHNAVCSLLEAGNNNFTPEQVYRCMNGLEDSQYVSPQAVGAITKSIDKSRRIYAWVDYGNEAKAYNKNIGNCIVEDYILSAKKITLEAGGKRVTGYKLNTKPILYQYAQVTGQVLTVPSILLNTKDIIRSTPEVTIIREYLIRRIEVMKRNSKNQSNNILFQSVNEEIGHPDPTKQKAEKIRDTIKKLLDKFIELKYIKDFEFYKEGRAFKGVKITY